MNHLAHVCRLINLRTSERSPAHVRDYVRRSAAYHLAANAAVNEALNMLEPINTERTNPDGSTTLRTRDERKAQKAIYNAKQAGLRVTFKCEIRKNDRIFVVKTY